MDLEGLQRFWSDLAARIAGPMAFRLVLQPAMAVYAAWHDGMRDARTGRVPYLQSLAAGGGDWRSQPIRKWLASDGRILAIAFIVDGAYQAMVLGEFRYPLEALVVAALLAWLPYLLLRGPMTRFQLRRLARKPRP